MRTAEEYRELAKINESQCEALFAGQPLCLKCWRCATAAALRKAAEMREALADVMEDVEMWGVDEYQFASCHRARAILGGEPHD